MYDSIETIQRLWQGGSVVLEDGNGVMKETKIYPRPLQKKLPMWITSAGNIDTFKTAGKLGLNILTHLLGETVDELSVKIAAYRQAYNAAGHEGQGKIALMIHTYIDEDNDTVHQKARQPFIDYLKTSISLVKNLAASFGMDMESNSFTDQDMEDLLSYSYDRYVNTASLIGTSETCARMLDKLSSIGVDEIASLIDFGIDYESSMKSLERLTLLKTRYEKTVVSTKEEADYSITSQLRRHQITHLQSTPSLIKLLIGIDNHKALSGVNTLLLGGEKLPLPLVKELYSHLPQVSIYNMYGPTETTVWSSCCKIEREAEKILIGKPIANTQIYILDAHQQPCGIGIPGEIYIAGEGVSQGYINREELNQERYINNPFKPGTLMYRTGDYGSWLSDGNIEYHERKDDQVKIRGYRIELGEIENALNNHPLIEGNVVLAREEASGEKTLVSYLLSKEEINVKALRAHLLHTLPSYMLPTHYIRLDKFPLTPSGKIDKNAIALSEGIGLETGVEYVAPNTAIEESLTMIWSEVLGVNNEKIGIKDNFFELGGDSIKSILVVSRLKQKGYSLKIQDLLLHPTIEEVSAYVHMTTRIIDQGMVEGIFQLSPIQSYFFEQDFSSKNHYNQSVLLSSKEPLSEKILRASFDKLVQHHDALRMVFKEPSGGNWTQENKGVHQSYSLELIEVKNEEDFVLHCDRIQSSINIQTGPLFKIGLFKCATEDRLLLVSHHLVIDGVSWRILFEDLSSLYQQIQNSQELSLPLKTDSFKVWQETLQQYSSSDALRKEEAYWSQIDNALVKELPLDYHEGSNLQQDKATEVFYLNEELTTQLLTQCYKAYNTEINDILLTGLAQSLKEVLGVDKSLIKLEAHGREQIGSDIDITRTVGWFTALYPVVLDLTENKDAIRQLIEVKENLHRVPNKGIGYGVLRYLAQKNYTQVPQIMFNYLGDFGSGVTTEQGSQLFEFSGNYRGKEHADEMQREFVLGVLGLIVGGKLKLAVEYSNKQYAVETIQKITASYEQRLKYFIEELSTEKKAQLTPVDLTYKGLSIEQLQELNSLI